MEEIFNALDVPMIAWLVTAIALFVGCTIQTAAGFGMAIVSVPFIIMVKPEWAPYTIIITSLILSTANSWTQRDKIQWKSISIPMASSMPGILAGTWLLSTLPIIWLQIMVAVVIMLSTLASVFIKPFQPRKRNFSAAGFISGVTGTTGGITGTPVALVMQHGKNDITRANLSIYLVYVSLFSLIGFQVADLISPQVWMVSLSFLPLAMFGYFAGKALRPWMDKRFRPIILTISTISASMVLIKSLMTLAT